MHDALRRGLGPAVAAYRTALADPALARLLGAWLSTHAGKWAFLVVNLVVAYDVGGAPAVGLMGLARYLVPTALAPLAGLPTARWRPDRVLLATHVTRTLAIGLAAIAIATGAPLVVLYAVVALEAGAGAFTRPLHMAMLPFVSRTPEELVAANVTSSAVEGLGTFVGPALAGILLVAVGPLGADLAVLAIYALGLVPIASLHVPTVGRSDGSLAAVRGQLVAGVRVAITIAGPRMVLVGLAAQTFVRGLLVVLTVVAAFELLGMGESGVGALNAAMGIGGLVGAVLAVLLTGRLRLIPAFTLALAGWGAPILVIGLVADPAIALVAMVVIGTSNAILDVAGFTLAQRTAPNDGRVAYLGLIDLFANGGVAIGGLVATVLAEALGIRGALVATGLILPITAMALWPFVRRVDERGASDARLTDLVRGVPLFSPLPLATVEHLAASLRPETFAPGASIMEVGDVGDRYVVIDQGEVEVVAGGRRLRLVGPGDGVGEIALLRDIPRTASVRALVETRAWALERAAFLEAVTGSTPSLSAATSIVDERLAAPDKDRPSEPREAGRDHEADAAHLTD